jgi:hypothetical protein
VPETKPVVKATRAPEKPIVSAVPAKIDRPKALPFVAGDYLESWLQQVPEVDLDPDYLKLSKKAIAESALAIAKENKDSKDAHIKRLIRERKDLAGLPFAMGKDCLLENKEAKNLAAASVGVRMRLAASMKPPQSLSYKQSDHVQAGIESAAKRFWYGQLQDRIPVKLAPETLRAYHQILTAEDSDFRLGLVVNLRDVKGPQATQTLINRAIYDLDDDVRQVALELLAARPAAEYTDALKKGLRHPWRPAVQNAARAIMALDRKEMIPDLVALFDEPDPRAPFVVRDKDGKERTFVREMVRINHHRNCMLCHAAVDPLLAETRDLRQIPVGPAPTPQEPLPPSSTAVYYSARPGVTIVRADVTYLRQDFSLMQTVSDPGKWPALQRFDFLVRTRELAAADLLRQSPGPDPAEYREVLAGVLHALTGKEAPPTASAWREVLAQSNARPAPNVKAKR